MNSAIQYPEIQADKRAGRIALAVVTAMILLSLWVQVGSIYTDAVRHSVNLSKKEIFLREATSHFAIIALLPIFPQILSRTSDDIADLKHNLPVLIIGAAAFSFVHICLMAVSRHYLFPAILGKEYGINLFGTNHIYYELRKDLFTFLIIMFAFVVIRMVHRRRLEADQALELARTQKQISLRSGASLLNLAANEVILAKAAGNYVEVSTDNKMYLARITLARLEKLLEEAGPNHIRIHRSFLINQAYIRGTRPDGEGGLIIDTKDGKTLPCSRHYRQNIDGAFASD